jgi:hypothetical protein
MDNHKTALVIITGGEVEIDYSLGRVITALASPAVLADIDRQSLTPSQLWHLERFEEFWVIDSYWFTALHTRQVNVKQYPFIQPAFQDRRAFSELIKAQLDLCAGVFEACDMQGFYPTHYDWFIAWINEWQQPQVNKILLQPDEESFLNKGEKEDGLRKGFQQLKKRQVPFKKSPQNQHLTGFTIARSPYSILALIVMHGSLTRSFGNLTLKPSKVTSVP